MPVIYSKIASSCNSLAIESKSSSCNKEKTSLFQLTIIWQFDILFDSYQENNQQIAHVFVQEALLLTLKRCGQCSRLIIVDTEFVAVPLPWRGLNYSET